MNRMKKANRVSWAPGVNLCQVKLFVSEDCPYKVGVDHLQVKTSSILHSNGRESNYLPTGFRSQHDYKSGEHLTHIPRIKWKCPAKFIVSHKWLVAAGEESKETEAQRLREMRVLEAIYPRSSAIPPSPSVALDIEEEHYNDSQTPLVPITPIEEEEEAVNISSNWTAPVTTPISYQPPALPQGSLPSAIPNTSKCDTPVLKPPASEKPGLGILTGLSNDVIVAASAALTTIMKSMDQGSSIDTDLLVKILNDPKMIEKLINDYGAGALAKNGSAPAKAVSAPAKAVSAPMFASKLVAGSTPLPCPKPTMFSLQSPKPAMVSSPSPRPDIVSSPSPRPDIVSSQSPRPAMVSSQGPKPVMVSSPRPKQSPKPAMVSSASPKPDMVSQPSPKPATSASPKPSMVSSQSTNPAMISSASPRPAMVSSASPRPAMVLSPSPRPAMVLSQTPKPAMVSSLSPKPAMVSLPIPANRNFCHVSSPMAANRNLCHVSNGLQPTLIMTPPQPNTVPIYVSKPSVPLSSPQTNMPLAPRPANVNFFPVINQVQPNLSSMPAQLNLLPKVQPTLGMMPAQPNSVPKVQPMLSTMPLLPNSVPVSSFAALKANPVKDINYIKQLIREHGGEKQQSQDCIISQPGNHDNHLQNLKLVQNLKPGELKPKFQKPCMYFKRSKGCRNGSNCPYLHDMSFQFQSGSIVEAPSAKRIKWSGEITGST